MSTIAEVAAALAAVGSDSGYNLTASVGANFAGGKWTVTLPGIWQGPPGKGEFRPTDFLFRNATATSVEVATQKGTSADGKQLPGAISKFIAYDVLAFDKDHVLLGQGFQSPNVYQSYYIIANHSMIRSHANTDLPLVLTTGGAAFVPPPPACYAAGTRILTDRGDVRVEDLAEGDRAVVLSGSERVLKPIVWIGHRRLNASLYDEPTAVLPIRIRRGAFAEALPARDLLVSPDHAIHCDGVLIQAKLLVNGGSIVQDHSQRSVHYFHVELAEHGVLLAEGLGAESYLDAGNRGSFANAGAAIDLRPDFSAPPPAGALLCLPMVDDAAVVKPIWDRLAARSKAMGLVPAGYVAVTDPELRIEIFGRSLAPISADAGRYTFVLPPGAETVRLLSRATIPGIAQPWINDHRRLGVLVNRLSLRTEHDVQEVALDDPGLIDGWWAAEFGGRSCSRWTNGRARVAMPAFAAGGVLEICLTAMPSHLVEAVVDGVETRRAA